MMQMLTAAGCTPLTDGKREADDDNPLGYYEHEKAVDLAKDVSWLPQARGKVVKIVAQLLPYLPRTEHYHVIFMERDLREVIASQTAMLTRQGRLGAELDPVNLMETYRGQLQRVLQQLTRRPELRLLGINYGELLVDPASHAARLAEFLGGPFDVAKAGRAVRPELQRQKQL
jgi:hypothetical protein